MDRDFRITGRHVLIVLIGFFLFVLAANLVFINLAVKSFPGEKEEKSYLQGLNYGDRLAARAEQERLGWRAMITEASLVGETATIALAVADRAGAPLSNLRIEAVLSRPVDDSSDQAIAFAPVGDGEYAASVPAGAGIWNLEGVAVGDDGRRFEFANRLVIK